MSKLDQAIADLVAADHQPRQAIADDGSVHMLFWDGTKVRSCLLADWPAVQIELAAADQARTDAAQLRQAIRTRLDALAGKRVDDLLVGDLKTLLTYLVWREGGLNRDLTIKPIGEWGK